MTSFSNKPDWFRRPRNSIKEYYNFISFFVFYIPSYPQIDFHLSEKKRFGTSVDGNLLESFDPRDSNVMD